MRVQRKCSVCGRVRFPDGRPAPDIVVQTRGVGAFSVDDYKSTWTRPDGTYELRVSPEKAYVVAVEDERWGAPTRIGVIVHDGRPVQSVDFDLQEGTVVRGQVTVGAERRPAVKETIFLTLYGGEIPAALKKPGDRVHHEMMHQLVMATDADGGFRFCVGPGTYKLFGPMFTDAAMLEVTNQREVVHDFHLPRPELGRLVGKVVDADGRPVAQATVLGAYRAFTRTRPIDAMTQNDGTFVVDRVQVPAVLYAAAPNGTTAGTVRIDAEQKSVTIRLGRLATAHGRLLDDAGKIIAGARLRYDVSVSQGDEHGPFGKYFGGTATSAADGSFTIEKLVPGEEYELVLERETRLGTWTVLKTIKPARAGTMDVGDVRVPRKPGHLPRR